MRRLIVMTVLTITSIALLAAPASAQGDLVFGAGTIHIGMRFDLSTGVEDTSQADADFGFVNNEGAHIGNESSPLIPGPMLLFLGNVAVIEQPTGVPAYTGAAPWISVSYDFTNGTGGDTLHIGDIFEVYTREGNYALLGIVGLPEGGFGTVINFEYVYNPTGSTEFDFGAEAGPITMGTSTLIWDGFGLGDFFDFSIGDTVGSDTEADFLIISNEGTNIGNEGTTIPGPMLLLMPPEATLDAVHDVPMYVGDAPWVTNSWDFTYGTGGAPISVGQVWVVYTREGNYAVLEVTDVVDTVTSHAITFDWIYQPDGSVYFPRDPGGGGGGGLVIGNNGYMSNQTGPNALYFDFDNGGVATIDTSAGYIAIDNNEGVNMQPVHPGMVTVYRLLGTAASNGEAETFAVPFYDAGNYAANTWVGGGIGTNGMPMQVGEVWAVYSRGTYARLYITSTSGEPFADVDMLFDYWWQPNGTTGELGGVATPPFDITIDFAGMAPHIGQDLYLRIIDMRRHNEVMRQMDAIPSDAFSMSFPDLIDDNDEFDIEFWVDVNESGSYDSPPTDHAWRLSVYELGQDLTVPFVHNTEFVDIGWPDPRYDLNIALSGFDAYLGLIGGFRIVDIGTGQVIAADGGTMDAGAFTIEMWDVLQNGGSYNLDLFIDVNANMAYDVPPTDHAWRVTLTNATQDTTIAFAWTDQYVDIGWEGPLPGAIVHGVGKVNDDGEFGPGDAIGKYFSFAFGLSSDGVDTTFMDMSVRGMYGPGLGYINTVPDYGFVHLLPDTVTLETIEDVPSFDGMNYQVATFAGDGPQPDTPVAPGQLWAVYGHNTYAVVEIIDTTGVVGEPVGVEFEYIWRPNGSTNFHPGWYDPLKIERTAPHPNEWNVETDAAITLQFDRDVDEASLYTEGFGTLLVEVYGETTGDLVPSAFLLPGDHGDTDQLALFTEVMPQFGERVWIELPASTAGTDGARLYDRFVASYVTVAAPSELQIVGTWPNEMTPPLEIGPEVDFIVNFSEPVDPATLNSETIGVFNVNGPGNPGYELTYVEHENTLVISHDPFALDDSVRVRIGTGVTAVSGNTLAEEFSLRFGIRDVNPIEIGIQDMVAQTGSSIALPILVSDLTGKGITSFQFELTYDGVEVAFDSISTYGTLVESGWQVADTVYAQDGYVVVTGASDLESPIVGGGMLVVAHFTHIGEGDGLARFDLFPANGYFFNEGGFPVLVKPGSVRFSTLGSLAGTVSYHMTGTPVDSVLVIIEDDFGVTDTAMTNETGGYEFMDVPAGIYTLWFEAAKIDDPLSVVTPLDAAHILQTVVKTRELSLLQERAADVTDNGDITAYDASHVLSFSVGNISEFASGVWLFDADGPEQNVQQITLAGSVEVNAEIILAGDVTANWGQAQQKRAAGPARVASVDLQGGNAWRVNLDRGTAINGARVIITAEDAIEVSEIVAASGWISAHRIDGNTLTIALAGADPIIDPTQLLRVVSLDGHLAQLSSVEVELDDGMVPTDLTNLVPTRFALHPAAPNPFNPTTQIRYELPAESVVRLMVFNALGQQIRTLVDATQVPGVYRIAWNGRDDQGREAASGSYMLMLRAGETTLHQRVMLVR